MTLAAVRKVVGTNCQPRFHAPHAPQPAIVCIADRHYCRECLLERIKNDPQFAAEALALLLAKLT